MNENSQSQSTKCLLEVAELRTEDLLEEQIWESVSCQDSGASSLADDMLEQTPVIKTSQKNIYLWETYIGQEVFGFSVVLHPLGLQRREGLLGYTAAHHQGALRCFGFTVA